MTPWATICRPSGPENQFIPNFFLRPKIRLHSCANTLGGDPNPRPRNWITCYFPVIRCICFQSGCSTPSGGPRQFLTPYGVEFVEMDDLQRIYIFDVGGPHTYRIVYMDGRPHPKDKDLVPDYYGHSVGRWEGDTLVVDSVVYNEKFWLY